MAGSGTPEQRARERIDRHLEEAGWVVQDYAQRNLGAGLGVAVREFPLLPGHGTVDYLLFVNRAAVGLLEAKREGFSLTGVEPQADLYAAGLPPVLAPPIHPLPFLYLSNGVETVFTNLLDPRPRGRYLFELHRPETLQDWVAAKTVDEWLEERGSQVSDRDLSDSLRVARPASFRSRLQVLPPIDPHALWPNQVQGLRSLEQSLQANRPRALLQMATGSGKTRLAITEAYRLLKYGGATRILFLVDRSNLGEQAETAFESYVTPDGFRRFTELYPVQCLTSNQIKDSSNVVIATIQRLYSMLQGEPDLDPALASEEESPFDGAFAQIKEPLPVVYNPRVPIELFDVIFIDECHRSIYTLWRQVLEYFDAFLIGLTATPAQHTYAFFHRNLVMEYHHEDAVAEGVNVDFEIYKIRTKITEEGSVVEAGPGSVVQWRNRLSRARRLERQDEDIAYGAGDLDRSVVAKDQIRTIVRTFRERLFTEIFPGRRVVPKTLIFAKDDSHAQDIVEIVREEFNEGNEFCQKITYKSTGKKPKDLIQDFRISYNPRIAVTVDMIATGTDIKPVEIVMFLREVRSRTFFEQMKGRGVRVIDSTDLEAVTPDAHTKTHFVLIDCVGISETELADTQPLERKKSLSLKTLLDHVASGGTDPEILSSLASRLARLDRQCGQKERELLVAAAPELELSAIPRAIVGALDPDRVEAEARRRHRLPEGAEPTPRQKEEARVWLCRDAVEPLASNPPLRDLLLQLKQQFEQLIDDISLDEVREAGFSPEAREKARALVRSFKEYLEENRETIAALEIFYSRPHGKRLRYEDIKALASAIQAPPRSWTSERLWHAYEMLDRSRVRGSAQRTLTDLVALVRFALHQEQELAPYPDRIQARFDHWMAQQSGRGRAFTPMQMEWLERIRDHIAESVEIEMDDFELTPFVEAGGLGRAAEVFGPALPELLRELNEELAA